MIVATQMLDSMVSAPTPTRAEASDVATAIYDGADAVMLSAESAAGSYPVEAVTMMARIIGRTEGHGSYRSIIDALEATPEPEVPHAVAAAGAQLAMAIGASAILVYTSSGVTAARVARQRPGVPVLALTPNEDVARQMALLWGTHSVRSKVMEGYEEMVEHARVRTDGKKGRSESRSVRLRRQVLAPERQMAAFDLENTLIASNVVTSYAWLASRRLDRDDKLRLTAKLIGEAPGLLHTKAVVEIEHHGLEARQVEQPGFGGCVTLHVAVIVEVIAGQVGVHRDVETEAVEALLVEADGRDFHRRHVGLRGAKIRQGTVQGQAVGRGVDARLQSAGKADAERADDPAFATQHREGAGQPLGDGCLAVGPGHHGRTPPEAELAQHARIQRHRDQAADHRAGAAPGHAGRPAGSRPQSERRAPTQGHSRLRGRHRR